jgi:CRP-like cAMP-binding protein
MTAQNLLLAVFPREALDRLRRHMQTVDLPHGQVLHLPNQSITTVYFPLNCLISITVTMEAGRTVEAGAVGSREMVGVNAFMGGRETNQTEYICQVPGTAVKMAAAPLLSEFDQVKAVRDVLLRFVQAYIAQLSQNVACNRVHSIEQRLARWLLEARDRVGADDPGVTHEFVAEMLGVRRVGVTETAAVLEARGLIECGRKKLRVIDAQELEKTACECFRVLRDEYDRLLDPLLNPGGTRGG